MRPHLATLVEDFRRHGDQPAVVVHRDTKDIIQYHHNILRRSGRSDLYRRRAKRQWNDRIQLLAQMHGGAWGRKLVHRMAWHLPVLFRLAGQLGRKATDATGSQLTFRLWLQSGVGEYWKGVRAAGETVASLCNVVDSQAPVLMFHSVSVPSERSLWSFYISPGKHGRIHRDKYMARQQPMPAAIVVGGDPLLFLMTCSEIPYGLSEYDMA